MREDSEQVDEADAAIRRRLAVLALREPDTRSLEARLDRLILDQAVEAPVLYRFPTRRWMVGGIAAALLVGLSVALLTVAPAQAARTISVDELIYAHAGALLEGHTDHLIPVASIEEADAAMRASWPQAPKLPEVGNAEPFACCVHHFGDRPAACLHLRVDGEPVSIVTADLSKLSPPTESGAALDGEHGGWRVYRRDSYTVIAGTIGDRCVCVVGRHEPRRLLALVDLMRFVRPAGPPSPDGSTGGTTQPQPVIAAEVHPT